MTSPTEPARPNDEERFVSARTEAAARAAHDRYEKLAPLLNYKTRDESAVPWDELPSNHRALMCASIEAALEAGDLKMWAPSSDAEKLREALRPFAEAADTFDHCADETLHIHPHVPLSDFRRARAALSESASSPETPR